MSEIIGLRLDRAEETLSDHELRIRALEKWAAWIGGGIGVITTIGQVIMTLLKA